MSFFYVIELKKELGFLSKFMQLFTSNAEINFEPTNPEPPIIIYFMINFLWLLDIY